MFPGMTAMRTRWAAIGAAVAVTLGAGGFGLVSATSPAGAAAFVPIEPCRVADTRSEPAFNTGPRNTPLGPEDTHTIAAHGDNGDCVGIPASATGVLLNVTALGATAPTFLAIWANSGGDRPLASSLNPAPGQPPTPNAVATQLSNTGEFNIFNRAGSVDVIVDINGYYTDHRHDDRYPTDAEVDAKIAAAAVGGPAGPPGPAGADGSDLFDRTIVVNGGGTPSANGDALRAAIVEVQGNAPHANDPWTVFLEPGLFQLQRGIVIPDHVTVTGSGIQATRIEKTNSSFASIPILEFGIGELRDLEVSGVDQAQLVASEDSMRVESVRFLVDNGTGIDLANGPHMVVDSEFVVTAVVNAFGIQAAGDVTVRGSALRSLAGLSVELIGMDGGDLTVEYSTIEGVALGIFSCCSDGSGTLKVRHSLIDVTRRPIVANLQALELEIEASTLIGVTTSNVVGLNAGGSVVMRQSTVVGGVVGGTGHSETCRGTTTATGFLSSTCP